MANNLSWTFSLIDQITGPANHISGALGHVGSGLRGLGSTVGTATRMLGGITAVGGMVSAALGAVGAVAGSAGVQMLSNAENTRLALTSMLGSTEKATNAMQYAIKLARDTPLEVGDVVKSMQRLIQQGFNPKQIDPILRGFADMGAQMGMTGADIQDMITIMGQIKMKPKLQAEELLQFAERGVPVYQMLSKQLGVTEGDVVKMASKGMISGTTAVAAITRGMEMFSGASKRNSTTLSGLISTIKSIPQEFVLQMDIQNARGGNDLLGPIRNVLQNIATIFDFSKEPGASIFKEASGSIAALIKGVFGPLATSTDPKKAGKVVMDFVQGVKKYFKMMAPVFDMVASVVKAVFPVLVKAVTLIWPVVLAVSTFISTLLSGKKGTDTFGKAANTVSDALQSLGTWFGKVWAVAQPFLADLWTIAVAVFKGISWAWSNILQPAFVAIGTVLTAVWNVVSPIITMLWNVISGVVSAIAAIIRGDWSAAWRAMGGVVSSIWTGIKTFFTNLLGLVATTGQSLWTAFLTVGGNIVSGLLQGITNGIGLVWEGIKNLGAAAVNGIKSFLGIKSPSTVFADLGLQTAAGMQQGLADGMAGVTAMGQSLANAALPATIPLPGINTAALEQSVLAGMDKVTAANLKLSTAAAPPVGANMAPSTATNDKLAQLESAVTGLNSRQAQQAAMVAPKVNPLPTAAPVPVKTATGGGGGISGPVEINVTVNATSSDPKAIAEQVKVIAVGAMLEALEGAAMEGGLWQTSS